MEPDTSTASSKSRPVTGRFCTSPTHWGRAAASRNSSQIDQHARDLVKLLRTVPSKLNLIPFNPFPGTSYRCSSASRIERFQQLVRDGGIIATVRKTRGDDIDAACGQLAGDFRDRTRRREKRRAEGVKL